MNIYIRRTQKSLHLGMNCTLNILMNRRNTYEDQLGIFFYCLVQRILPFRTMTMKIKRMVEVAMVLKFIKDTVEARIVRPKSQQSMKVGRLKAF